MKTICFATFVFATLYLKDSCADEDSEPDCNRVPFIGFSTVYLEIRGDHWFLKTCPRNYEFVNEICGCHPRRIRPNFVRWEPKPVKPRPVLAPPIQPPPKMITVQKWTRPARTTTTVAPSSTTTTITTSTTTTTSTTSATTTVTAELKTTKTPKRICEGCKLERGVGYVEHESDCDKYVMCYPAGTNGELKGETRQCSIGQYWDQNALTCRPSTEIACKHDKCAMNPYLHTYGFESDCRGYWKCENGVSIGNCCPKGYAYRHGFGCVKDHSCNTMCGSHDIVRVCDKRASKGNPARFQQIIHGNQYVEMNCPTGLVFINALCECGYRKEPTIVYSVCKKELDLDFKYGAIDTSGNNVHVEAINVTIGNGMACFHGDGALVIPRFSNVDIGANLEIHARYSLNNKYAKHKPKQALVYNGDCDFKSSMAVAVDSEGAYFGLSNKEGAFKQVSVKNPMKYSYKKWKNILWNDASFSFHNKIMAASLNGRHKLTKQYGNIARSRCGLKIGWGKDYNGFYGCIDKISISFCPPEKKQWAKKSLLPHRTQYRR